jgi:hypothetical protein
MKNIYRLLLVAAAVSAPSLRGQGFYTSYDVEGEGDGDPSYLYTVATAYPGSGSCSAVYAWNSLNGDYLSGWAPAELESSTYGTDGVNYTWNYGIEAEFLDPLLNCDTTTASYTAALGFAITTSINNPVGVQSDSNANCPQLSACTNTATPLCPISTVNIGVAGASCTTDIGSQWRESLVPILNNVCKLGFTFMEATGPGYCTPAPQ